MSLNGSITNGIVRSIGLTIAILIFVGLLLISVPHNFKAVAQSANATLVGTVLDTNGLAVPGATVTAINLDTGLTRTATTDGAGEYVIPSLPIGTYRLDVTASTFAKKSLTGIRLQIDQRARINMTLDAGAVTATVDIPIETPLAQTESGALGVVIENRRIVDLPLDKRLFLELTKLTPGVTQNEESALRSELVSRFVGPNINVFGARESDNNYTIDGVAATDRYFNSLSFSPSIDAIEEFKIQSLNYSAEVGGQGGANINVSIKSGTDTIHGSLFSFMRNDAFDARNPFDLIDRDGDGAADTPPFKRYQYGGTLGGPIIKDRTFYFGAFEGLRERKTLTQEQTVPTLAMRNGDFRALRGAGVDGIWGNADDTGRILKPKFIGFIPMYEEFPTPNVIDRIDPTSRALLNRIPLPNRLGLTNNYIAQPQEEISSSQYIFRVDHNLDKDNSIYARFLLGRASGYVPFGVRVASEDRRPFPGFGNDLTLNNSNLALVWSRTFSSTFIGEARLGYNRVRADVINENDNSSFIREQRLQGIPADTELNGYPRFVVRGYPEFGDTVFGGRRTNREFSAEYSIVWIKGSHTLKLGALARHLKFVPEISRLPLGEYVFGESDLFSGNAFSDFLLGYPSTLAVGDSSKVELDNREYAAYIETDWRASKRLTLNLGLRYELYGSPEPETGNISTFDINTNTFIISSKNSIAPTDITTPGYIYEPGRITVVNPFTGARHSYPVKTTSELGLPDGIIERDLNNFAPRIGFAYDLTGDAKTILRGGYGIFYSRLIDATRAQLAAQPPYFNTRTTAFLTNQNLSIANAGLALGSSPFLSFDRPIDPCMRTGYMQQWNLTAERVLGSNIVLNLSYVGSKGSKLIGVQPYNHPLPGATVGGNVFANFGNNTRVGLVSPRTGSVTGGPAPQTRVYGPAILRLTDLQDAPGLYLINYQTDNGYSNYHGGVIRLQKRFSKGLAFDTSYTYSKSIDNDSLGYSLTMQDVMNPSFERARSSFDIRHRFISSFTYDLPFGKGRKFLNDGGLKDWILGGWNIGGILNLESGLPFTVHLVGDYYEIGSVRRGRPNLVGDPNAGPKSPAKWFNTSAFRLPPVAVTSFPNLANESLPTEVRLRPYPIGQYGSAGRNIVESDGIKTLNLSLFKNFALNEKVRVQFRTEVFNLLNTTNWGMPNREFIVPSDARILDPSWNRETESSDFGRVTNTRTDMRKFQFAIKILF
jgi:hypothetical protein